MAKVVLYDSRDDSPTKGEVNEFFLGEQESDAAGDPAVRAARHEGRRRRAGLPDQHADRALRLRRAGRVPRAARTIRAFRTTGAARMADKQDLARARVLVTGGAGFIGSNFVHRCSRGTPARTWWCWMRSPTPAAARTSTACRRRADVRARRHPRSRRRWRRPWRAATSCSTSRPSRTSTARSRRRASSSRPTSTACSCCAKRRAAWACKRFIQVSTDEVYGEVLEGHSTEDWPLNPRSPYAASKAGGDRLAYAYCVHLRPAGGGHALLQQLRAAPVPGEARAAVRHQRDRRRAAAGLRQRA